MRRLMRTLSALLALCVNVLPALAAPELPREPVLRIETGAHLAPITRISGDADGRWAVTAAEDKTARVWDLRSGKALAVLRPPLGSDSIGALYAVAMSPDGRQVAAGGNAAFDGKTHALYLFDRATGTLPAKSTLSGIEAPVTQLAWSADSRLLAVGLRQEGLRLFRRDLGFVGADPEYNDAIYGADFARDGRLAVASLDGSLRLYALGKSGLERLARRQVPGRPYGVAWSPDGSQLAVGLQDAPRVLILSAGLELIHTVDVGGEGNLGRVAWSSDGGTLYAAGNVARGGHFPVLAMAGGGRVAPREIGSFANTVSSLFASSGRLLAASAEPSWALLDGAGGSPLQVGAGKADFRDAGPAFRVSGDGQLLGLPMTMGGREGVVLDLARGDLHPGLPPEAAKAPIVPARLSNWRNSPAPQWDGRRLNLRPGELSRSVAGLPDGEQFVLGTEWFIRLHGRDGAALWERRVPGAAWAVNVSADGRWVVAALGDGSVRWFRSADGTEQLAVFVHADRERWIAWTPSGYYDTSMGGESLVGWHVNRAFNQAADFFSVGRFRERYYQPSMIQKVLQYGDEAQALRAHKAELEMLARLNADAAPAPAPVAAAAPPARRPPPAALPAAPAAVAQILPPVVELQSDRQIETKDSQVPVRYLVRTASDAPVKEVKFRVNGKLERSIRPRAMRTADGQVFEALVPVPPKDAEIVLIAENQHAKSEPLTINVRRPQQMPGKAPYFEQYDTLYMLVVAVNKYPGSNALQLPVKDASDFRRQMTRIANAPSDKPRLYRRPEVRVLVDEEATQTNIRDGLKWLADNVKERDAGVIFLAGHGISQEHSYYFIPWRAENVGKAGDWVAGKEIVETLQSLPGRAMFFLDTCHSGALANQAKVAGTVNQVDEERGVIVFASATAKELAQETDEWGNGAFTKALIEGLRGEAEDPRDKLVYPTGLKRYVTRRVRDLTDNQQRPYVSDHGIDDPIAVVVK